MPSLELLRLLGKSTIVMSDYHLCRYDAILGVLICVGDDADVLVLGKDMCRVVLPTPHGVHWLDCFVFAGTSTFVLLCNEMFLCMDYRVHDARSVLKNDDFIDESNSSLNSRKVCFTCLHVPQGMTCGAVGCSDGKVRFFRFVQQVNNNDAAITNTSQINASMSNSSVNDTSQNAYNDGSSESNNKQTLSHPECAILAWTIKQVNIPLLCQPFHLSSSSSSTSAMKFTNQLFHTANNSANSGRFLHITSVLSLDSYPENPNTFIAIVAGVSGVCKWYVEDERISCFFDASSIKHLPDPLPVVCKVTPGGTYVAAVTMHCTRILLWSEAKKKKNKCSEIYWMIDLSHIIALPHLPSSSPSSSSEQLYGNNNNVHKTPSNVAPSEAWELAINESFWYNEYRVGIQMARTALENSFHATNDRHSQLYILVHGQHEIVEVVVRVDDKQIWRCEPLVAQLNAFTACHSKQLDSATTKTQESSQAAHASVTNDKKLDVGRNAVTGEQELTKDMVSNYFNVFHVEPCVLSNYWHNAWTDIDLEILIVTSLDGLRPLLAQRNRKGGGIERITELRELPLQEAWRTHTQLLRLPGKQLRELASLHYPNMASNKDSNTISFNNSTNNTWHGDSTIINTLHRLLRGGDPLLRHCVHKDTNINITSNTTATSKLINESKTSNTSICNDVLIATVTDKHEAVALAPRHNEIISLQSSLLSECVPWSTLAFGEDTSQSLVLQQALPLCNSCEHVQITELLLRVFATENLLTVMKIDLRRRSGGVILNLDRSSLHLSEHTHSESCMVKHATLLQASLENCSVTNNMCVRPYGTSLLLLLCDSSVVIIDLCNGLNKHTSLPAMLFMPAALLPVNSIAISLVHFWLSVSENQCGSFCLAYLFAEGKGLLLWNVSSMRMIHYSSPSYALHASSIQVINTAPMKPCNLSGDVHEFSIICHNTTLTAPTQDGLYGLISLHDALGVCLFSCSLKYGLGNASTDESSWCISTSTKAKTFSSRNERSLSEYEQEEEPNSWVALPLALSNTSALCLHFNMDTESRSNSIVLTWSIGSLNAVVHSQTVTLNASVMEARAEWGRGIVELLYNDDNNEMVSCQLNNLPHLTQKEEQKSHITQQVSTINANSKSNNDINDQSNEPTLAFISKHELVLVALHSLLPAQSGISSSSSLLSYAAQTTKGSTQASCKLDHTRRIECVMECTLWRALLIVTCDNNGWRWINFLHSYSAEPIMTAEATLDFAGDDQVNVIAFIMSSVLHVYLLGTDSGTIGHFHFVSSNSNSNSNSSNINDNNVHTNAIISRNCFGGPVFHTLPCTFRGYGRFLPPQPTMKEETGFFKRLMTLPWEDVVLQMESVTLRQVSKVGEVYKGSQPLQQQQHELQENSLILESEYKSVNDKAKAYIAKSVDESRDNLVVSGKRYVLQAEKSNTAIPARTAITTRVQELASANNNDNERVISSNNVDLQSRKDQLNDISVKYKTQETTTSSSETQHVAGSRYAQLKAIAEREHVSLTEARRMMSENVRKLQERGEKIGAIENKSSELAQQALTFQELARQLKEKKRNSWL